MVDHKTFANKRTALYWIEPRKIQVRNGLNARDLNAPDNRDHIEFLARSIEANGFLASEPLELDKDGYLTAGHCRLAAVMLLIERGVPIEFIPYVPEKQGTNEVDRIVFQSTSNSGKSLTPLEEGYNVKRLLGLGLDVVSIAKRMGRSETHVNNLLDLQEAPREVRDMVQRGEVAATLATKTLRQEGVEKGSAALTEAVAQAKSLGKTKATAKHVQARAEAQDDFERFKIKHNAKKGLLTVRIGMTNYAFTPLVWGGLARKIVIEADLALAKDDAERVTRIAEDEHEGAPA